jgi:hypothetical protein
MGMKFPMLIRYSLGKKLVAIDPVKKFGMEKNYSIVKDSNADLGVIFSIVQNWPPALKFKKKKIE